MCVSPQALLDAVVARVCDRGERLDRVTIETLLAARLSRAQILAAFERARAAAAHVDAVDAAIALLA